MEQFFINSIQSDSSNTWLVHLLIMTLVSMIPFAPIPLLAAYVASNHNFFHGLFINILGTTLGSVFLYLLSKKLLRQVAIKYLNKQQYLKKYISLIEKNGFLAVLLGRIVPILPSAGINLIAGISNIRLLPFISATLLGKLPTILAFSFAGHQIAASNWNTVLIITLYLFALFLIGKKLKHKWSK